MTRIMGVLNVTPDSFSDGGKFLDVNAAVSHAKKMIEEGADIIDVGGESSRPGSDPVPEEEELKRVLPVITALAKEKVAISIDTCKPAVAEACLKAGARIVNDISGLNDEMAKVAANNSATVVIMHMQGRPKTMQERPQYKDVVNDIKIFFKERIERAKKAGIKEIILDPGIGFGKNLRHNLLILSRLNEFKDLNCQVMIGTSRKSFIENISGVDVGDRLEGTIASNVIAIMNGADIIRVHDVKECRRAAEVADAVKGVQ